MAFKKAEAAKLNTCDSKKNIWAVRLQFGGGSKAVKLLECPK